MVEETQNLLLGQFEGVELVEETEGGGGDSSSGDSSDPSTHPGGAPPGSLAGPGGPGLQVVNFVIDLVHHLVKRSHLKQLVLQSNFDQLTVWMSRGLLP